MSTQQLPIFTTLHEAVEQLHLPSVQKLRQKVDVKKHKPNLLALAARGPDSQSLPIVMELLTAKAVPDPEAMHVAASLGRLAVLRALLDAKGSSNAGSSQGTPLTAAINSGDEITVAFLLDHKAELGFHPLQEAISKGHSKIVQLLLKKNATSFISDYSLRSAAVKMGKEELVKSLLEAKANINDSELEKITADEEEVPVTPLMRSLKHGRYDLAKVLLEAKAYAGGAVKYAVELVPPTAIHGVLRLLNKYPSGKPTAKQGYNLLKYAMQAGNIRLISTLLSLKVAADYTPSGGESLLELAKTLSNDQIFAMLQEAPAKQRRTAVWTALWQPQRTSFLEQQAVQDQKLLDQNKLQSSDTNPIATTPSPDKDVKQIKPARPESMTLEEAIKNLDLSAVQRLIKESASLSRSDSEPPLLYLTMSQQPEKDTLLIIKALLDAKAEPRPEKLLYKAIQQGKLRTLKYLLSEKANANATEKFKTILQFAAEKDNNKAVEILLEYKAKIETSELSAAVWNNNKEIVTVMLEHKPEVKGSSLLLDALEKKSDSAIIKLLINAGVDIEKSNAYFYDSPLFVAMRQERYDVVDALLEANAIVTQKNYEDNFPLHAITENTPVALVKKLIAVNADMYAVDNLGFTPLQRAIFSKSFKKVSLLLDAKVTADHSIVKKDPLLPEESACPSAWEFANQQKAHQRIIDSMAKTIWPGLLGDPSSVSIVPEKKADQKSSSQGQKSLMSAMDKGRMFDPQVLRVVFNLAGAPLQDSERESLSPKL